MANGYARASNRIAVVMTITGPGVINGLTPIADAFLDSVPMVMIATQAPLDKLGKGAFHELKDQSKMIASVAKWSTVVHSAEEIPRAIRDAFIQAWQGRPGPTVIEVPMDIQYQKAAVDIYPLATPEAIVPADDILDRAAQVLGNSESPLLFIGRGAALSGCSQELLTLMDRCQIPCYTTSLAKGIVPEDHPLNISWGGARHGLIGEYLPKADTILVVGSSLDEAEIERLNLTFSGRLIQIDTCPEIIGRKHPVFVPIIGDAKVVLEKLIERSGSPDRKRQRLTGLKIKDYQRNQLDKLKNKLAWQYMDAIQQSVDRDAIITNDASWANDWAISFLQRYQVNTFQITRMTAALGFAFPAALGAKLAYPKRQALALVGDGGFLFTVPSLATAVQYHLNPVTVIFNDSSYSSIGRLQNRQFHRQIGVSLKNPDFQKLTEAFGAASARVKSPEELFEQLVVAWEREIPTVIEVSLDKNMDYLV
jgi:acetolactate synthase-1/2/3 large subunit